MASNMAMVITYSKRNDEPGSCYVDAWQRGREDNVPIPTKMLTTRRMGAHFEDKLQRVPALGGAGGSSVSQVVVSFHFTVERSLLSKRVELEKPGLTTFFFTQNRTFLKVIFLG